LAAGDPRIAEQVRWVNAFGAFADAASYLASVSAHAYRDPYGTPVRWTPTPLAREVYLQFMLDQVSDRDDRRRLDRAFADAVLAGDRPAADPALRSDLASRAGRTVHDILTAVSLDRADRSIRQLPPASLTFIDVISPLRHLTPIRADVHLMHETEDHHVPFVESRALAAALDANGRLSAHTEFRLFDHVQPDDLDLVAAAPELLKLLLHVRSLMEESL